jgi:hypothetical protein
VIVRAILIKPDEEAEMAVIDELYVIPSIAQVVGRPKARQTDIAKRQKKPLSRQLSYEFDMNLSVINMTYRFHNAFVFSIHP